MAKLSRKQAEEALHLKKEGLGYRKIEERLKEKYSDANVPAFSSIYAKLKPIIKGEKTLDEAFPREGKKSENEKKPEESEGLEVGFEGEAEENSSQSSNVVLVILWILFAILVALIIV